MRSCQAIENTRCGPFPQDYMASSQAFNFLSRILRDFFCLPLPSRADLGDRPILRIFKVIVLIATYRDTHTSISILFVANVGLVSSLVRYELIQTLSADNYTHVLYFIIWICVLISSISCCWLYVHILVLMIKIYHPIWKQSVEEHGRSKTLIKLIFCCGLAVIAILKLHSDMSIWGEKLQDLKLPGLWFYYVLWFFRLLQRSLACCFITLVLPVTQAWLIHVPHEVKELLVQLVPWQIFHTIQRILLRLTLVHSVSEYWSVYGGGWFVLSWCFKLWPLFLAFTVANSYIFPILYTPKDDEKKEIETKTNENENEDDNEDNNEANDSEIENNTPKIMVTGLTKPIAEYPEKAELVNANVYERYNYFLHPLQGNPTRHTSQRAQLDTLYNTQPYEAQDVIQVTPEDILVEEPAVNLEEELLGQLESDTDKADDVIDEIPFADPVLKPEIVSLKDPPADIYSTQDSPLTSDEYTEMSLEPTEPITSGLRLRQNIRAQVINEGESNVSSTVLPASQGYQSEAVDVEQGSSRKPKEYVVGSGSSNTINLSPDPIFDQS